MIVEKPVIGFIGSGGIARAHAYSLSSLKFYYNDAPEIELQAVCSATRESRQSFGKRFGFIKSYDLEEFAADRKINTVFILGPNNTHFEHLKIVLGMSGVRKIYLEKPVCSNREEEKAILEMLKAHPDVNIQAGFQFLFSATIRDMLRFWKSGKPGDPIHFDLKYYHSDYLAKEYRDKRRTRLTPAPDGGAMADLGSHSLSLLIAFLGKRLRITGALQGGHFPDVKEDSDLFSLISVHDEASGAVGTLSASRISAGMGDYFFIELCALEGSVRYSSVAPDYFEFFTKESGIWSKQIVGSNYQPESSFPSAHVPPGWLRSMIHAQYVFLTGKKRNEFIPDIYHALEVQKLVRETSEQLQTFRETIKKIQS